jgi:hypothetical protein
MVPPDASKEPDARFGELELCSKAEFASALRTDTPKWNMKRPSIDQQRYETTSAPDDTSMAGDR